MTAPRIEPEIDYPEDDGLPMSENTEQFDWIQLLTGNLAVVFGEGTNTFVGGDLLWYPVQSDRTICRAPDAFVVLNRPRGRRSTYNQWEENNLPMTVVFEVRSPNDSDELMQAKFEFYQRYGSREYYLIDPERVLFQAFRRVGRRLVEQEPTNGRYTSPLLGIHFDLRQPDVIRVLLPNGDPFLTSEEREAQTLAERRIATRERRIASRERRRANQEARRAEQEAQRAEQEAQRAEQANQRAEKANQRTARILVLANRMLSGAATADEIAEFNQLQADTAE